MKKQTSGKSHPKVTLVAAYPGTGKTYVMCYTAAKVSRGEPLFDGIPLADAKPGKVLYLTAEDGIADTIKQRLRVCGANMKNIFTVATSTTLHFDDPEIAQLMDDCKPDLMIFDPMQSYMGAEVDMNAANKTREKLNNLVVLAEKHNTAMVAVCHFNKNSKGAGITRVLGSTDITGICRSYIAIGNVPGENGTKFMSHEKSSLSAPGQTILFEIQPDQGGIFYEGTNRLTLDDYTAMAIRRKGDSRPAIEAAKQFLVDQMPEGRRPAKEIQTLAAAQGISTGTLQRARKDLGIVTQKTNEFRSKSIWVLPGHLDDVPEQATFNFA
ncbi:MAG: AAA family ATPase [Clostridiales bacterium]|nr:AAA family ATPase [Clostridiales bacterium]